nr:hypothetical protein [Tanacetum cinerariifolium]
MKTDKISDRFVAPRFINGLEAYDGEINLGVEENMILNEFAVKLCLDHEVKSRNKVVKKELIVALRGEIYFVMFIPNQEEDDVESGVVLGRSFLRLTKAVADFGARTVTICPEIGPFFVSSEEKEKIGDDWDLLLVDLDFGDILDIEGVDEEAKREVLAISIYKRYSLPEEDRLVIETMAYSNKYKKIIEGICLDKMKLDGMNKEEEETMIKIKGETEDVQNVKNGITILNYLKAGPMGLLRDVLCQVGVTTIIAKITSTFDGICHQTFRAAQTSLDTAESDSDDEEEYVIQRNKFEAPIYGPKPARYLNYSDPLDQSLALQEVLNPFRKICVWKKVVSFLGSFPVVLQHVEWKPDYTGCFNKKEDSDGQWHAEIRLTEPYGNVYDKGFVTKKTTRKLAKYHKLSDIMSPNWF